jgi:hypothetical protein
VAQHHAKGPVPVLVVGVEGVDVASHAHDVDEAIDAAQLALGLGDGALDFAAITGVGDPRDASDLVGHLLGQRLLVVDAEDPRPGLCERVGGLPPDALARPDDHEAAAVETEESRVVGNR